MSLRALAKQSPEWKRARDCRARKLARNDKENHFTEGSFMKRTKKFLVGFLACLSVFSGALGLVACGGSESPSIDKGATEGLHYQKIAGKDEYRVVGLGMAEETDVVISSTYKGLPVTEIGDMAFYVLDGAMSLTSITIPDGVKSIGDSAFYKCDSLTSIVIPDSVTSIGEGAFYNCENLTYNEKNNLKYLGNEQNPYLYLAGVSDTSITRAAIENTCKWIGDYAFSGCDSLTGVFISDSVTFIGYSAFSYCDSLTSIFISDSVTSIGYSAFSYCDSLTSIEIGGGVTFIGDHAFWYCESLTSITFNGTKKEWNAIEKGDSWKSRVPATKVVCSDGEMAL